MANQETEWVIIPKEPTDKMVQILNEWPGSYVHGAKSCLRKIIEVGMIASYDPEVIDLSGIEVPEMDTVEYQEDQFFIVQGLQYDICASGKSAEQARENFELTVRAERQYRESQGGSLDDIGPAPREFWEQAGKEMPSV